MKIGIDIDEVIVEFVRGYIKVLEEKGIKVSYEQTQSYNFWECFPITKEEAFEIVEEFFDSEHFENIELIHKAQETINYLVQDNKIFFITSRPQKIKDKTLKFVNKHFPGRKIEVIFSGDFHKGNGKTKAEICSELGIDFMIEDNRDYALDCAKKGINVFLMNKPWNKPLENFEGLTRVNSWDEIKEKIENITK